MSLRPNDRAGRSRSKSRERSKSRTRVDERASSPSVAYAGDPRYSYSAQPQNLSASSSIAGLTHDVSQYEIREPSKPSIAMPQPPQSANPYERTNTSQPEVKQFSSNITMGDYTDLPPHMRPNAAAANFQQTSPTVQYAQTAQGQGHHQQGQQPAYGYVPSAPYPHSSQNAKGVVPFPEYAPPTTFQYAPAPDKITYTAKPQTVTQAQQAEAQQAQQAQQAQYAQYAQYAQQYMAYAQSAQSAQAAQSAQNAQAAEAPSKPGGKTKPPPSPRLKTSQLSVKDDQASTQSAGGSSKKMNRLSVSGNRPDVAGYMPGQFPPASPLLEAYHGTYQSISPMPSPYLLAQDDLDDLPPLSPIASASIDRSKGKRAKGKSKEAERQAAEEKKRVKVYDAEDDALALVDALTQSKLDADTLIDILPALTHDEMLELRTEYKRHCKVQGRGINLAKHIKMKMSGNFGKICHVTALGRWESEGYWANFWYQSNSAKRELLIESLMGRSNAEIRAIKEAFKDKRYGDSLTRCMDKELKADKFRTAVLLALEERRQEEQDVWPIEYRNRDVDTLYSALKRREGGETAIIQIVVQRSDNHLREVLKTYERKYQGNFARDALKKSNNLVGEVIAHILNGVINRPARDAMLLNHALEDLQEAPPSSRSADRHERQDRYELLISRLVRFHWDRLHLTRVKSEYRDKYGRHLQDDIEDATRGDFCEFCLALCDV